MSGPVPADKQEIGDTLDPLEFRVTPELNQQYLFAEEDFHPRYLEEGPWGQPLVHPSLLLNMSNITRSPSFFVSPGMAAIHASEQTTMHNPARVGQVVRVTWRVVDKLERRGRPYQIHEALVQAEDGTPILTRLIRHTYSSSELAIN